MPDTGTGSSIQQKKFHEYDVPKPPFSRSNSNYSTCEYRIKNCVVEDFFKIDKRVVPNKAMLAGILLGEINTQVDVLKYWDH